MPDPTLLNLLKPIAAPVAGFLFNKIKDQSKGAELQEAINAGFTAAIEQEDKLQLNQRIFYRSKPDSFKGVPGFIKNFFNNERVQNELTKPFNERKWISVSYLIDEFKQTAQRYQQVKPLEDRIEPWLKAFIDGYFQNTPAYHHFQDVKNKYFEQLIQRYGEVEFGGMAISASEVDRPEELLKIFVVPDVKAQKRDGTQPISANKLLTLSKSQKLVLLGAPGSGKTSLINYLSVKIASQNVQELDIDLDTDWLPIIIKIPDLAASSKINMLDYVRGFVKDRMHVDLPENFFKYWLDYGRGIILLDSLDEIKLASKRSKIAEDIKAFLNIYKTNKAIITSRPAGYRGDFFNTNDYPVYQLQSFDEEKIKLFIQQWHQQRFGDTPESQQWQELLQEVLEKSPRIQLLARNPFLLTIIAFIHRYQTYKLPQRRSKLYDMAVETFLINWETYKNATTVKDDREETKIAPFKYIDWEDARRLMERLAYLIHTQNNAATEQINTLIDKDPLIELLSEEIEILKQIDSLEAKGEAKRFLQYIQQRTGLFNEQGLDIYGFVHLTFQEYLCAKEIYYQQRDDGFEVVKNHLEKYLDNSDWQEVLLLLLGEQTGIQAAKFLNVILHRASEDNNLRYHHILFAGMCLSENPKNLHLAGDRDPSGNILQELVNLELSEDPLVDTKIKSQIRKIICDLKETDFQSKALEIIEQHSDEINPEHLQQYRETLAAKEKRSPDN